MPQHGWLWLAVLAEAGLVAVAVGLGRWVGAPAFGNFRWDPGGLAWGVVATVPLLLALRWCLRTKWGPIARLVALVEERLGSFAAGAGLPELAVLAVLAGVGEEALFRGVAQESLASRLPPWIALLGASVLFGVAHWITFTYAVLATIVGAYLGTLYAASGNLLAPIVTHALYDLAALSILARLKPAPPASVV